MNGKVGEEVAMPEVSVTLYIRKYPHQPPAYDRTGEKSIFEIGVWGALGGVWFLDLNYKSSSENYIFQKPEKFEIINVI